VTSDKDNQAGRSKLKTILAVLGILFGLSALVILGVNLLRDPDHMTVEDVMLLYGSTAQSRLQPYFDKAGVPYPPKSVSLLALKDERVLEVWATGEGEPRFIRSYKVVAASGSAGPKLREGDRQVPEGIYEIEGLNPNSSYHLSIKLNYPNAFDLEHAKDDGRTSPGSDIFIHGSDVSIGCLAMGDRAIEELFVLVEQVGRENVTVLIAPHDPRKRALEVTSDRHPPWTADLYRDLEAAFSRYSR